LYIKANFMDMIGNVLRKFLLAVTLVASLVIGQEIPIVSPHLLPFPGIKTGLSYFSLKPTQNMEVTSIPGGWTIADTMRGVLASIDLEILRYRWWDHFQPHSKFDAYSSLHYSTRSQIGNINLPSSYPSTLELNGSDLSGFNMNMLIRNFSVANYFAYDYSRRGSLHATLGMGLSHLSLYKNGSGIRTLESTGYHLNFGLGWKMTLFGRLGKRFRLGVDMGYTLEGFNLADQGESLKLPGGASGEISPIQTLSLRTPDLNVSIEFGEALFGAYTPFRDPYKLGLLNLSSGWGMVGLQTGASIHYDSTGTELSIPFASSISQNFDLQIFKYNWPFQFIRQANIDVLSGVGIRLWKMALPTSLPSGWAVNLTDGSATFNNLTFSPRIYDIYLDHEIIYPFGSKIYTRVRGGTGFASMTLYENKLLDRLIDATAFTWHVGMGAGYTIKGDGSSRVSLGLNLDYVHQAFEIDMASSNLSAVNPTEQIPITYIDLSQPIVSLNIGLIFGGYPNAAMKAYESFKNKHYTLALEKMQELLQFTPNHHNKEAVLIQKQMVEDSLVAKYYRDVRTILSKGKIIDAHALIQQGEKPPGEAIERAVQEMKIEIADRALEGVAEALKMLDYELAEDLILLALKSDPSSYPIAKVLLARSYIIRATVLYQSGVYGRSLYWLRQADGLTDRYEMVTAELRQKIGDGRLDDANEGILKEDRQMVYESMKEAKSLNPVLSEIVDAHLDDLEQAIKYADEQKIAPMKRMALDNLMDDIENLNPENFIPKLGMKGSLIVRYIGPPERKFREGAYELYVYPKSETVEIWLYLRDGSVEKVEYQNKQKK
jgi:tetratricopeptide (TPR) repeat protein